MNNAVAGIPFDARKSPADLAAGFVALLKKNNPNVRAFNWQTDPRPRKSRFFSISRTKTMGNNTAARDCHENGRSRPPGFRISPRRRGTQRQRGLAILQGLIGSVASGSASKPPSIDYTADPNAKMDRNAQAFMFVLEFALGAPFTQAQEGVILDELKSGWRALSEKELQKYDQYPVLVQTILKMGQKDLEELRVDLEKTIKEWLDESDHVR